MWDCVRSRETCRSTPTAGLTEHITCDAVQGDELLPPGERVYYDDYGERFVVDEQSKRVRRDDVQQVGRPHNARHPVLNYFRPT